MLCGTLEVRHSVLISIFFMLACCNVMMCGTLEVRHSVCYFNFLFIAGFVFLFDWCNKKNWRKGGTAQQIVPQNIDNLVLEDHDLIISMRLIFRVI